MINQIGIYRGSFDPPHLGHFEVVDCALRSGMTSVTLVYKDINRFKPFRSSDKVRELLLRELFAGRSDVAISRKTYKATLSEFLSDTAITTVYQIIGSDILDKPVRPIQPPTKLAYFIIPRVDYPISTPLSSWNNLPVQIADEALLFQQHHSSTRLRYLLFEKDFLAASEGFPFNVFDCILDQKILIPTENEYRQRMIIQEVRKIVEEEITIHHRVSEEIYPLSFHLGNDIEINGLSGDMLCFIKDKDEQIVLAVKVFLGEEYQKRYQSELLGYEYLTRLKLSLVKVPDLLFSHHKKNFALIGMNFISGKTLAELMLDSSEAIRLCARANLELHMAQRTSRTEVLIEQIAVYEEAIQRVVAGIDQIPSSFLTPDIASKMIIRWALIRQAFIANPGLCSFTHGDPNHWNWILDLENQHVTYIDLSLFKKSVSSEGTPCGFAVNELEEAILSFKVAAKRIGRLPKEKILEMQEIYRNEYRRHAPADIATPEATQYFTSYWSLRVMENLIEKIKKSDSIEEQLRKNDFLKQEIKSFLHEDELN